jgi:hypothetical protein
MAYWSAATWVRDASYPHSTRKRDIVEYKLVFYLILRLRLVRPRTAGYPSTLDSLKKLVGIRTLTLRDIWTCEEY